MPQENSVLLSTLPQESLSILERMVAARFNWRIFSPETSEQPRFLIEKQVRYYLMRGWTLEGVFQIAGSFYKTKSGETELRYEVSGHINAPLIQAVLLIGFIALILVPLTMVAFGPNIPRSWVSYALPGVLVAIMVFYGWFSYRCYQGHLQEMHRFMQKFTDELVSDPR
jgi:hypothetical protein